MFKICVRSVCVKNNLYFKSIFEALSHKIIYIIITYIKLLYLLLIGDKHGKNS